MPSAKYSYRPSDSELRRLYVEDGQHCTQIAKVCGADPKTIWEWLRAAGIQTRKRGSNKAVHFVKGQRSAFAGHRHTRERRIQIRAQTIARGGVPYLRNGVHWLKGQPPEVNPNYKGGATPERQEFYRSAEWKAVCVIVWQRANACCERCGTDHRKIDRRRTSFHVHHITSFHVREWRAEPSNLALLCRPCHLFVHSKANVRFEFLACPAAEKQMATPDLFSLLDAEKESAA